jgi:hypothetical protein
MNSDKLLTQEHLLVLCNRVFADESRLMFDFINDSQGVDMQGLCASMSQYVSEFNMNRMLSLSLELLEYDGSVCYNVLRNCAATVIVTHARCDLAAWAIIMLANQSRYENSCVRRIADWNFLINNTLLDKSLDTRRSSVLLSWIALATACFYSDCLSEFDYDLIAIEYEKAAYLLMAYARSITAQ